MEKGNPMGKNPPKKPQKDDKKKKPIRDPKKSYEPEAWMLVAPKDGEPKTKTVDNKSWHWCPNHNRWACHKASKCLALCPKPGKDKKAADKKNKFAIDLANAIQIE